jgi:putative ABC transport system ATP-binding protein
MIKVENLKKTYQGKIATVVLKGLSFTVSDGEFMAIMGRSGSGKSTLLHQLGLIDTPTDGKIIMNSVDVTTLSEKEKTRHRLEYLGYVFQEYALIVEFTALENVFLPAMAYGRQEQDYKKRALELLSLVGLGDRAHHYPNELSGGEQQRVAIARALINNPIILFADEPTANLDTESSKTVLDLFKKLNKELKQTIIMVTHEPDDKQYVHKVLWLRDGLLEREELVRK